MKLITTTGYGATGSSVITDLLQEFSCVESKGEHEFRFLFDVHGVRELEVVLFQLNNRQNIDYYIKAFKKYIKYIDKSITTRYYKDSFNGKFKRISDDFINSIIDVKWQGYWHKDVMDENIIKKFFYYLERFIQKKIFKEKDTGARYYKKTMYYANPISHEEFLKKVKNYINELIKVMNTKKEFMVLDQLVPPENTSEFLKYFDDLKIIIVDRDPRDHYLLEKYEYGETWVPFQDVKTYVKWYKLIRSHRKKEIIVEDSVMFVNFEDFIYDYEKTVEKVVLFCGIDKLQWTQKRKYFNPSISIKNTRKWLSYPQAKEDIDYIEKHLSEYLINYEAEA